MKDYFLLLCKKNLYSLNQLFKSFFYVYFLHDPIELCLTSSGQYHHRYLFFFKDNLKKTFEIYAEHFQFELSLPGSELSIDLTFCTGGAENEGSQRRKSTEPRPPASY